MRSPSLLKLLMALAIALAAAHARAEQVTFAGVSFLGNSADVERRYPNISAAIDFPNKAVRFQQLVKSHIQDRTFDGAAIHFGDAMLAHGNAKVLAFAFSGESFEAQRIDGKLLARYGISAQVLVFDFALEKKQLLASWPVRVAYVDTVTAEPSVAERRRVFETMLFDLSKKSSIVSEWTAALNSATLSRKQKRIRIASVIAEDKALAAIPSALGRELVLEQIGQFFEGEVSKHYRLPMLPYSSGLAIDGTMKAVFADGGQFEFDLPDPDFTIGLKVREFRKAAQEVKAADVVGYGAFVTITISSPALQSTLLDARFRNVAMVTLPKGYNIAIDDWPQFQTVLFQLLEGFAAQANAQSSNWAAEMSSTADVVQQLRRTRERLGLSKS